MLHLVREEFPMGTNRAYCQARVKHGQKTACLAVDVSLTPARRTGQVAHVITTTTGAASRGRLAAAAVVGAALLVAAVCWHAAPFLGTAVLGQSAEGELNLVLLPGEGAQPYEQEQQQQQEEDGHRSRSRSSRSQAKGSGGVPCPVDCTHTCNLELGRCDCPPEWEGPSCTEPSLPLCRQLTGLLQPCLFPSTCSCHLDCNRYSLPHEHICLPELSPDDGTTPLSANATFLLAAERHARLLDFHLTPDRLPEGGLAQAIEIIAEPAWALKKAGPPADCRDSCHGHGLCTREEKACICTSGYSGAYCEKDAQFPYTCYSACSGKGRCEDGVCVCEHGFFGIDCSLTLDAAGAPMLWRPLLSPPLPGAVREGERVRPLIYVYELPPHMNQWLHRHNGHVDREEVLHFLQWLLESPYRTANGYEADYFFIPIYLRYHKGADIIYTAIDYIRNTWPFYNTTDGHRHMLYLTSDWGACETGSRPWGTRSTLLANFTLLTLWCHKFNMFKGTTRPCFVSGQDVCMPPDQGRSVLEASPFLNESRAYMVEFESAVKPPPTLLRGAKGLSSSSSSSSPSDSLTPPLRHDRKTLVFFRGFFSNWEEVPLPTELDEPMKPYVTSFGFRQRIFDLFVNFTHVREGEERPNMDGVSLVATTGTPQGYLDEALNATFCLAPAGFGWAMRTTQAVLLGCIPVLLQDDVEQPFEGELIDWDAVAVRVKYDQLPSLLHILRNVTDEEVSAKRNAGRTVWQRFVHPIANHYLHWDEKIQHKHAFESAMEVLRRRVQQKSDV